MIALLQMEAYKAMPHSKSVISFSWQNEEHLPKCCARMRGTVPLRTRHGSMQHMAAHSADADALRSIQCLTWH